MSGSAWDGKEETESDRKAWREEESPAIRDAQIQEVIAQESKRGAGWTWYREHGKWVSRDLVDYSGEAPAINRQDLRRIRKADRKDW